MPDLTVNGETLSVSANNLKNLIEEMKLNAGKIAIELNDSVIKRAEWENSVIKDGDCIEIISFVGGG